jgi:alpha-D-xyloside xylohydrolase
VWNLAKQSSHYEGITRVMHLRENLRQYVADINVVAAETGMPMMRPMFLQWPHDEGCQVSAMREGYYRTHCAGCAY